MNRLAGVCKETTAASRLVDVVSTVPLAPDQEIAERYLCMVRCVCWLSDSNNSTSSTISIPLFKFVNEVLAISVCRDEVCLGKQTDPPDLGMLRHRLKQLGHSIDR